MRHFFRRRVLDPLVAQLTQGVSPNRLALALSLGVIIGVFPILGTTTIACAIVAYALKLNQPAIQVGNFIATPLLVVVYVPLFDVGAWMFGMPSVRFTFGQIKAELAADLLGTMEKYFFANMRAVTAWSVLAPPVAGVLFFAVRFVLRRVKLPAAETPK